MSLVLFLLAFVLVMPRPVELPLFHPLPPVAPMHMGRRRQRDWGRLDQHGRQQRARADPVPVLREWARALSAAITGPRSWYHICVAACVLYGVYMLFPGVVDLVALFVGAFKLYVGTRAANAGVAIQRTAAGLAVALSAVTEALRWRYGPGATTAWRAPRLHYGHGARLDVVRDFIGALWDQSQPRVRGDQQNVPAIWWDNPLSGLMLFVGWCPGLLAREAVMR